MKFRLPKYSGNDYVVMAISLLPLTVGVNCILFRGSYFTRWDIFLLSTPLTGLLFATNFVFCTGVAASLKKRLPAEEQTNRRMLFLIICTIGLSGISLLTMFHLYELFPSF